MKSQTEKPGDCQLTLEKGQGSWAPWRHGHSGAAGMGGLAAVRLEQAEQGDASLFQWQDMQRGDLPQVLPTHRYLVARPTLPALAPTAATGPALLGRSNN